MYYSFEFLMAAKEYCLSNGITGARKAEVLRNFANKYIFIRELNCDVESVLIQWDKDFGIDFFEN